METSEYFDLIISKELKEAIILKWMYTERTAEMIFKETGLSIDAIEKILNKEIITNGLFSQRVI